LHQKLVKWFYFINDSAVFNDAILWASGWLKSPSDTLLISTVAHPRLSPYKGAFLKTALS
jgi:hypothetical protein